MPRINGNFGLDSFEFNDPWKDVFEYENEQTVGGDAENGLLNPMAGYVPHTKQIMFHSDAHKRRLYIGGNRS